MCINLTITYDYCWLVLCLDDSCYIFWVLLFLVWQLNKYRTKYHSVALPQYDTEKVLFICQLGMVMRSCISACVCVCVLHFITFSTKCQYGGSLNIILIAVFTQAMGKQMCIRDSVMDNEIQEYTIVVKLFTTTIQSFLILIKSTNTNLPKSFLRSTIYLEILM